MKRVTLDRLYPDMKEATIGRWLKAEGENVSQGEPIVELITDKVTFELESPATGPLRRVYAPEKSVMPIGTTLAALAEPDEALPDIESENRERVAAWEAELARQKAGVEQSAGVRLVAGITRHAGSGIRATPSARRLARENGVDLAAIPHSGDGPITERDVQAFLEKK